MTHPRRLPLVAAVLWALVCLLVSVGYHISEPAGVLSITIGNQTYTGNPPALSLYQRDQVSILLAAAIVFGALLVSAIDVEVRWRRKSPSPGVASAIVGAALILFSLFGLLWGVLSIGVVGLLLIVASRPFREPRPSS